MHSVLKFFGAVLIILSLIIITVGIIDLATQQTPNPYFVLKDFEDFSQAQHAETLIKNDEFQINNTTLGDPIRFLNLTLETPNLYEQALHRMTHVNIPAETKLLEEKTQSTRTSGKKFSEFSEQDKQHLLKFNRSLLRILYPSTIPATSWAEHNQTGAWVASIFFFFVGLGGLLMYRAGVKRSRSRTIKPDIEKQILQAAEAKHGKLTATEAAAFSDFNVEECRNQLKKMMHQQLCDVEISIDGVEVYVFHGILDHDTRNQTEPVI